MTDNVSESATYQQMLTEVEQLVAKVSAGDMPLDAMIGQVERGFELIAAMRQRLDDSKVKIETIRAKYQEQPAETPSSS